MRLVSGGVLCCWLDERDTINECDAPDDLGHLIFALQAAPCFGGGGDALEDHPLGGDSAPWVRTVRGWQRHFRSGSSFAGVLGGEVIKGERGRAVLFQALDRRGVFGAIFRGEMAFSAAGGPPDRGEVLLLL